MTKLVVVITMHAMRINIIDIVYLKVINSVATTV